MRFLLDECLPYRLAGELQADGHEAAHVYDIGFAGKPDHAVMAAAREDGRVLLSADTDFGEILAKSHAPLPSVIIFRMSDLSAENLRRVLALNTRELEPPLRHGVIVVISDRRIRYRPLPI